ncbi:hypothetical protein [Endozoicomonas ascidiicola]|uniref:hypothetical protein n=1 Tax=Endozoicomonas ascidiicola TaxID=1698521 RepID=UPI000831FBB9|nr:hypothetical protein [Endozoicomonas ascidiicola]
MHATTPFKKTEAFEVIKSMRIGETPTELELDRLYLFFAPTATRTNMTGEQWVAKAVAKNDVRFYLNYVHVKEGAMYASDGHRLRWIKTDKENGFYCPKTLEPVDLDAKFPEVERIINNNWGSEGVEHEEINVQPTEDTGSKKSIWRYDFLTNGTGSCLQKNYMDSALSRKTPFTFTVKNDGTGVYGEYSDGAKFIVMGMRV